MDISDVFLAAIINAFGANKRLADRAVEQVSDESSTSLSMRIRTPSPLS